MWKYCCSVFDYLTLAAVRLTLKLTTKIVDGKVLCVHGGLSPDIRSLDQIRTIQRCQEIPHEGPFCGILSEKDINLVDLVWSDPEDIDTWAISPRGAGWLFGHSVTTEVCFTKS